MEAQRRQQVPPFKNAGEWNELISHGMREPDRLALEPCSYGVRSALVIAENEISALGSGDERGVPITPGHLLLGMVILGHIYKSTGNYGPDALAVRLYEALTPGEGKLVEFRTRVLSDAIPGSSSSADEARRGLQRLFDNTKVIKERSTQGPLIALRHLLAALIQWSATSTGRQFRARHGIPLRTLHSVFSDEIRRLVESENPQEYENLEVWDDIQRPMFGWMRDEDIGTATPLAIRETGKEQLCLNVEELASAIAETIAKAPEGDFCMAIKGQWGRGKTTLIREVIHKLEPSRFRRDAAPEESLKAGPDRGTKPSLEDTAVPAYGAICFNVWKYPNRPQVWVHLYQEIYRQASKGSILHQARLVFHQSLNAVGWLPLYTALLLLLVSLIPLLQGAAHLAETLGLSAVIFLVFFFRNAGSFFRTLRLRYFTPVDHSTHLGLQATIGDDLRNLLKAWIHVPGQAMPSAFHFAAVSLLLFLCAIAACYRLHAQPTASQHVYWMFVALVPITLLCLLRKRPKGPDKVLLVADDLDRCPSDSMIGIIESLRLMLEEKEIYQRMQTVILFDESILRDALESKYAAKLERMLKQDSSKNESRDFDAKLRRLVQGQLEKYFLLELHLPPLNPKETKSFLASLLKPAGAEGPPPTPAPADAPERTKRGTNHTDEINGAPSREKEVPQPSRTSGGEFSESQAGLSAGLQETGDTGFLTPPVPRNSNPNEFQFMPSEIGLIETLIAKLPPEMASPRSIRSFLMRCQLAIFILTYRKTAFDAHKVIRAVGLYHFGIGDPEPHSIEYEVASHVV